MKLTRIVMAVLLVFGLTSCSSTKLAYGFLDTAIHWQIGKYVSLNRDQKDFSKTFVRDFHTWHRTTQLPLYADYIDSYLDRLNSGPTTGEQIHKETDELQLLLDNSVNYILPSIVDLTSSFNDEQVKEFMDKLKEDRDDYKDQYIDVSQEKLFKTRRNDLTDQLGQFFGRFTDEQKQWIDTWSRTLVPYEVLTLKQQELFAEKMESIFAIRQDKTQLLEQLKTVVFYRTDDWDPELEKILDKNQEITYDLIAKLVNSQTETQRHKMVTKLNNFSRDFRELAADE